jgi:hypothetical protein
MIAFFPCGSKIIASVSVRKIKLHIFLKEYTMVELESTRTDGSRLAILKWEEKYQLFPNQPSKTLI